MRLYTHHNPCFDLINSHIDLNKSLYYKDEGFPYFKKAYDWLFNIIKTDQIVWCYPSLEYFNWQHGYEQKLWTLEVPQEYIICSIYDDVWDHVINDCHYIPEDIIDNIPDDKIDEFIDIWEQTHNKEKTWEEYIFDNSLESQVIIRAPVREEWVVETSWFSGYEIEMIEHGTIRQIVKSNEDRDRMIEIYKAFLDGRKAQYSLSIGDNTYSFIWNNFNE